jgi:hypothetical protein
MGLSFTIAAGPRQRIHSWVRVPWDSRHYFTVSDSRLPFLSPSTTRRTTVEVFYTASTRECSNWLTSKLVSVITSRHGPRRKHRSNSSCIVARGLVAVGTCFFRDCYLVTDLYTYATTWNTSVSIGNITISVSIEILTTAIRSESSQIETHCLWASMKCFKYAGEILFGQKHNMFICSYSVLYEILYWNLLTWCWGYVRSTRKYVHR